jgi:hypothetical protein
MMYFWLVILFVATIVGAIVLISFGGSTYSTHDAETHATEYAGTVREAHGPITLFLWACYAAVAGFTVWYSWLHWAEVIEMFRMMH